MSSKRFIRGFDGVPLDVTTWREYREPQYWAAEGYRCPECGWVGTEDDMLADAMVISDDGDEAWSNWICPQCKEWWRLEDYQKP
jgi:hypothetical protein